MNEKKAVALSSVLAAILLTTFKLVVGLLTGSLGILSEAAHSGLDLVAALITLLAVRTSDRPADDQHPYGHGKVENLSAFFETLLLVVTCVWIIYEAVERLFFKTVTVEITAWAFAVVILSIVVDISRSRALLRVARRHRSQALEADALHFRTDIWSSCVVLVGLVCVWIGERLGSDAVFAKADALAALGVAGIVIVVSFQLGKRSVNALLDSAPEGLAAAIEEAVAQVDGVLRCKRVRLREAGNKTFVDIIIDVERNIRIESNEAIADAVEMRVHEMAPGADVVVHSDPVKDAEEDLSARIHSVADRFGYRIHNLLAYEIGEQFIVELHLEVDQQLTVAAAHDVACGLEERLVREIAALQEVHVHIEPRRETRLPFDGNNQEPLVAEIAKIAQEVNGVVNCHDVRIKQHGAQLYLSMHCTFPDEMPLVEAHDIISEIEHRLVEAIPGMARVMIHPEPRSNS